VPETTGEVRIERVPRRLVAGVFLACLGVYPLTSSSNWYHIDGGYRFALTRALAERGSIVLGIRPDGSPQYSKYGLVQPVIGIPFYLTGKVLGRIGAPKYWGSPEFYCNLHNAFVTAAGCCVLLWGFLRLGFTLGASLVATAAYAFATGAWPAARWYGNEPAAALLLMLFVFSLIRVVEDSTRMRDAILAGIAGGLTVLNRQAFGPLVALLLLWAVWRQPGAPWDRRHRAQWAAIGLIVIGGVLAALAYNHVRTGSPFRTGYEGDHGVQTFPYSGEPGFSSPLLVGLYGNLFSTGRSVFLYSPPVLVAVFCFGLLWRRNRAYAFAALVCSLYQLLFWSKWWSWYGGMTWGNRALLPVVPLLMPAVAAGWEHAQGWKDVRRWLIVGAIVAGILVQLPALAVGVEDFYTSVEGFNGWTFENEYRVHFVPQSSPLAGHFRLWRSRGWRFDDLLLYRHAEDLPGAGWAATFLGCLAIAGIVLTAVGARRWDGRPVASCQ